MYTDTIELFTKLAERKIAALHASPGGFFVASMLAGAYVGIGIILIFVLGQQAPLEFQKLIMGATFGIALTLVVIAGAELFTGHTMFMALRGYRGMGTLGDIGASWVMTWIGNLAGSLTLVGLFAAGGGAGILSAPDTLLMKVALMKVNAPGTELFARAILCNWLVCLAIWMAARVKSESAQCIVIFWCLLAFIASGYEHSVANMTLLGLALAGNHPQAVSLSGFAWNLAWVTAGNVVGGAIFVAGAYYVAAYGLPRAKSERQLPLKSHFEAQNQILT
jgi:nitrite transporter